MQLVERVARAACAAYYKAAPNSHIVNSRWSFWIPEARASIAVQRELIQQLRDALDDIERTAGHPAMHDDPARISARTAIAAADAALREQP